MPQADLESRVQSWELSQPLETVRLRNPGPAISTFSPAGNRQVEEPGACDLDLLEHVVALERLGHFRADLARVGVRLLRELERVVALVVAKLRIGRGQHPDAAEVLAGIRLLKGRLHNIAEFHKS